MPDDRYFEAELQRRLDAYDRFDYWLSRKRGQGGARTETAPAAPPPPPLPDWAKRNLSASSSEAVTPDEPRPLRVI
jgi:hypothetical protein